MVERLSQRAAELAQGSSSIHCRFHMQVIWSSSVGGDLPRSRPEPHLGSPQTVAQFVASAIALAFVKCGQPCNCLPQDTGNTPTIKHTSSTVPRRANTSKSPRTLHHVLSSPSHSLTNFPTTPNMSTSPPVMDARTLAETSRQLSKAHDGGDPPSTLLALLSPLEKWRATEDLLRQSKIGIAVAKLRSSKDPKVASLASTLINKWKGDVNKGKKAPPGGAGTPGKEGLGVQGGGWVGVNGEGGRSGTSSPAPAKKEEVVAPKKFSVPPEKRTAKEDGVETALTGNASRDGCITLIYNGLVFMSSESPDDILAVTRRVEQAALEEYGPEANATYRQKMRSLHLNLKMKQNTALRRDVFSGAIEPARFVKMTSEELKSEEARRREKEMEKENMSKAMTAQEEKAISTTFVYPLSK